MCYKSKQIFYHNHLSHITFIYEAIIICNNQKIKKLLDLTPQQING